MGLLIAVSGIHGVPVQSAQTVDVSGVWLATDVPSAPWTFEFKQDGTKLTGTVKQNQPGPLSGPVDILEGSVIGNTISMKIDSPNGATTMTFTGPINGDQITMNRTIEIHTDANQGGRALFGPGAAPQFTIKRGVAPTTATAPLTTAAPRPAIGATATPTAIAGAQHWEVNDGVAFKPWTFDLKIEGGTVTGSVGQARSDPPSGYTTTNVGPFAISEGKAEGSTIDFKVVSSGRVVSFHGTRSGDQIAFMRDIQVTGDPGRDGILGASGATRFTAVLNGAGVSVSANPSPNPAAARANLPTTATAPPRERWQVTGVPNAPWIFDFAKSKTSVTGTISQNEAPAAPVSIAGGWTNGSVITFKVLSPDAERVIAFTGRINGNEMSVVREITPLAGGTRGGNDLYGGSAPLQFIANRVVSVGFGAANRPAPTLFTFKGMSVDVSSIQSLPNRDAILDALRGQINIIDAAITDPAQKSFVQSVPLVMAASLSGADNAAYVPSSKNVMLTTPSYSPEKPVVLHELMHAYHDQKLSGGFGNTEIQQFYQQAKNSGKFPANSYMLSSVGEYFAMMSSVYLHGSAARDPNTRQEIKDEQPDFYQWLVKEFGPR
jgi:hypothetical protein